MGQGGWASYELAQAVSQPVTISLQSPIPLETDLDVVQVGDDIWRLVDPASPEIVILEANPWRPVYPETEPVSITDAQRAREAFPLSADEHPAPHCVSCGLGERSLGVHAGPLGDGRWATPFRVPDWSLVGGKADEGMLWMAMDCACGWYTQHSDPPQRGLTVQLAVTLHEELKPNTDYALVAWNGDHPPRWDGRKRGAAAALFADDGTCIAQSTSFWVEPRA